MSFSQGIPLSMLARNTMLGLRARYPTRSGGDEETPGPRAVSGQGRVSNSQGKATVRESQLLKEDLGPVEPEAGLANARE